MAVRMERNADAAALVGVGIRILVRKCCVTALGRTGQLRHHGKFGLELVFADRLVLVRS